MIVRKWLIFTVLMLILSGVTLVMPQSASAVSAGCATINGHSEIDDALDGYQPGALAFDAGDLIIYHFSADNAASVIAIIYDLADNTFLSISSSLDTTVTGTYEVPTSGILTLAFNWTAAGTGPGSHPTMNILCGDNLPGPTIPVGFTLHTISCTTPLYDLPAHKVVERAVVKAGQTWFVDADNPVKDASGKWWVKIFVSSYNLPYVPASCVAGVD